MAPSVKRSSTARPAKSSGGERAPDPQEEDERPKATTGARLFLPPALILIVCVTLSAGVHLPVYGALGALATLWDSDITPPPARPVEVTFLGPPTDTEVPEPAEAPVTPSEATEAVSTPSPNEPATPRERRSRPEERVARRETPPEPEPEPEPEAEPEPERVTVELPEPPREDRRSVVQDSENPEVEAPDDARFLAEENRDVEEETVAEVTSTVTDDADPTTSTEEPTEPSEAMGDGAEEIVADARDVEGSDERHITPDEARMRPPEVEADPSHSPTPTTGSGSDESGHDRTAEAGTPARGDDGGASAREGGLTPTREVMVSDGFGSYMVRVPDVGEGSGGGASAGARRDGSGAGERGGGTRVGRAGREGGGHDRAGERSGRSMGLSWSDFEAVYGEEELEREREARLEERRSRSRGASREREWAAFRAAMENYVPEVRPGNQTALDSAASPFAAFLNQMHVRIHRHFADGYIASLGPDAPEGQNDPSLLTTLEVALNHDGTISRVGIVRSSGNTMFDFAAFNSVYRAQPFPEPPDIILSGDGHAWLRWTFERGPRHCGTWNAEPFILDNGRAPGDPLIDDGPDEGAEEHGRLEMPGVPDERAPTPAPTGAPLRHATLSPTSLRRDELPV